MPPKRGRKTAIGPPSGGGSNAHFPKLTPGKGNPVLPNVPAKQSWAYGSSTTPILPHKMQAKPTMNLVEMANTIDDALQNAKERDGNENASTPQRATRSTTRAQSRLSSVSHSPVRRPRREPTPDQIQLLDSLRATTSPEPLQRQNSNDTGKSSATPTPPVPHTFSTTSSPKRSTIPIEELYPSPLQQLGSPLRSEGRRGSEASSVLSSVDDTIISWGIEREVHGDDLQRTRLGSYHEDQQGTHIGAPPRRFSGLAFAHETIEEEEEPPSEILKPATPSQEPTPATQKTPEPKIVSEPFSARVKTIIPDIFTWKSSQEASTPEPQPVQFQPHEVKNYLPHANQHDRWSLVLRILLLILLTALSTLTIYSLMNKFMENGLPFDGKISPAPPNATSLEALNSLSSQLGRLGAQVSSLSKDMDMMSKGVNVMSKDMIVMSKDVKAVKTEVKNLPIPTTIVESYRPHYQQETQKTNFLTIGLGVIVDPWITSPTAGPSRTLLQKMYLRLAHGKYRLPQPPQAALTPWEDVGECWCSVPREGMSQLAILLGHRIVPEEVVVEHMPKGATVRPDLAPKDIELWARYRLIGNDTSSRSWIPRFFSRFGRNPTGQDSTAPNKAVIHGPIMDTLRQAYVGEEDGAFSEDKLLGPYFYRIGRFSYDIAGANHIQKFSLDAVIDSPELRVDKVVFRVKSNWGANNTCIYRLKLFGHL